MKPITAVAFHPDAPVDFIPDMKVMDAPSGNIRYIDCTEVGETAFGFLQLTPKPDNTGTQMTVFVPPSYVAWMLRGKRDAVIGFLPPTN